MSRSRARTKPEPGREEGLVLVHLNGFPRKVPERVDDVRRALDVTNPRLDLMLECDGWTQPVTGEFSFEKGMRFTTFEPWEDHEREKWRAAWESNPEWWKEA